MLDFPCALCDKNSKTVTHVVIEGVVYLVPACNDHAPEVLRDQPAMEEKGFIFTKYAAASILEVAVADNVPQGDENAAATSSWCFTDRPGRWTNSLGEEVPIASLSKKEFIDAVLALTKANFARITSRVAWTKELKPEGSPVRYPPDALKVGSRIAGEKLEDFKEVAERRKWI